MRAAPRLVELRLGPVKTLGGLRSAIFKEAVEGPVWLGREGLAGDAVADRRVHGGPDQAVLAVDRASYAAWTEEGFTIEPGAFGENLSLEGFGVDEACVGDVIQLGEVRLQVTHPRVPCGTLQKRLALEGILPRVWETARGGFYLRVLEEGWLRPGLELQLLQRPNPGWTARRALHARWKAAERPEEALALAALPELSADWRERLPRQAKGA